MSEKIITQEQIDFIKWIANNVEFDEGVGGGTSNPDKKRILRMFNNGVSLGVTYMHGCSFQLIGKTLIKRYGHLYKRRNKNYDN